MKRTSVYVISHEGFDDHVMEPWHDIDGFVTVRSEVIRETNLKGKSLSQLLGDLDAKQDGSYPLHRRRYIKVQRLDLELHDPACQRLFLIYKQADPLDMGIIVACLETPFEIIEQFHDILGDYVQYLFPASQETESVSVCCTGINPDHNAIDETTIDFDSIPLGFDGAQAWYKLFIIHRLTSTCVSSSPSLVIPTLRSQSDGFFEPLDDFTLLHILSFIPVGQRPFLRVVNRRFRDLIKNQPDKHLQVYQAIESGCSVRQLRYYFGNKPWDVRQECQRAGNLKCLEYLNNVQHDNDYFRYK